MKVTCPACSAKYTVSAERLDGRRVRVRCKRCGQSFPVEPLQEGEEVYACVGAEPATARHAARIDRGTPSADLFAGIASAGAEESVATRAASTSPRLLTGERNENSVL